MESISELRGICQPDNHQKGIQKLAGMLTRYPSIYLTRFLLGRSINAKLTGMAALAAGLFACLFFLCSDALTGVIGALILWLALTLQEAAKELHLYNTANSPDKTSPDYGLTMIYFETINRYILLLLIPLAFSYGIFKYTGTSTWLIIGMLAAVFQVLLQCMHHGQESALLRKINGSPNSFIIKEAPAQSSEAQPAESKLNQLMSAANVLLAYPGLAALLLITLLFDKITGGVCLRQLALLIILAGSFGLSFITISRKIKNNDPDKQFFKLFDSN